MPTIEVSQNAYNYFTALDDGGEDTTWAVDHLLEEHVQLENLLLHVEDAIGLPTLDGYDEPDYIRQRIGRVVEAVNELLGAEPRIVLPDPFEPSEYDLIERDAIEHEPPSRWTLLRRPWPADTEASP